MTLDDAMRAACGAVVGNPREAWTARGVVEAEGVSPDTVDGLIAAGVLVAWDVPGHPTYLTLTPWGAWVYGEQVGPVWIDEVWRADTEDREESPDRPLATAEVVHARVLIETPVWREGAEPEWGEGAVVLPRHGRIGRSLVRPEMVRDERPGPPEELILDEDGAPLRLFAGGDPDPGVIRGRATGEAGVVVRRARLRGKGA
jgi:hypothetical protein